MDFLATVMLFNGASKAWSLRSATHVKDGKTIDHQKYTKKHKKTENTVRFNISFSEIQFRRKYIPETFQLHRILR